MPGLAALKADALTTWPVRRSSTRDSQKQERTWHRIPIQKVHSSTTTWKMTHMKTQTPEPQEIWKTWLSWEQMTHMKTQTPEPQEIWKTWLSWEQHSTAGVFWRRRDMEWCCVQRSALSTAAEEQPVLLLCLGQTVPWTTILPQRWKKVSAQLQTHFQQQTDCSATMTSDVVWKSSVTLSPADSYRI